MMLVTFKLSTHTKFWSLLLFFSILFLSLGLYFAYMWISNYYFSDYVKNATYMFFTQAETYFIVLFCVCLVLFVDGIILAYDS
jgi:phospholipid-transporting ATPase